MKETLNLPATWPSRPETPIEINWSSQITIPPPIIHLGKRNESHVSYEKRRGRVFCIIGATLLLVFTVIVASIAMAIYSNSLKTPTNPPPSGNLPSIPSFSPTPVSFSSLDFAGSGRNASIDGVGSQVSFNQPTSIKVVNDSFILVLDFASQTVRNMSLSGNVQTIMRHSKPIHDLVVSKNYMYFVDGSVLRLDLESGILFTITDQLKSAEAIAIDSNGDLIVADTGNGEIVKFKLMENTMQVIAKAPGVNRLVTDTASIYYTAIDRHCIYKLANSIVTVYVGTESIPGNQSSTLNASLLNNPKGLYMFKNELFVADQGNQAVKRIVNDSVSMAIQVDGPVDLTGTDGNLFVTSTRNRIFKLVPS